MSDNEKFTEIFQELSTLKQFAKVNDGLLLNMTTGCKVEHIEELKGGAGGGFLILGNEPTIKLSWGETSHKLTLEEAERFLELMKGNNESKKKSPYNLDNVK